MQQQILLEDRLTKGLRVLRQHHYNLFLIKHIEENFTFHLCNLIMHTPAMNIDVKKVNEMEDDEIIRISEWLNDIAEERA
jgi:hypothetical protein